MLFPTVKSKRTFASILTAAALLAIAGTVSADPPTPVVLPTPVDVGVTAATVTTFLGAILALWVLFWAYRLVQKWLGRTK